MQRDGLLANIAVVEVLALEPNADGLIYLAKVMVDCKLASSAGEARRAIDGGAVKINGEAVAPKGYNVAPELLVPGTVLQSGKRKWAKLV